MKVAIVHYHLGHGGVPQTIRAHSVSLRHHHIPHIILTGYHLPEDASLPVALVPELNYADHSPSASAASADAADLAEILIQAATRHLGSPPDLWHIHNHSLGKNPSLTEAVAHLARNGERLLLHIHDLAEDGRPALYATIRHLDCLYPLSPRIHYAFLNERDRTAFLQAGLPETQSHFLEGSASPLPIQQSTINNPQSSIPPATPSSQSTKHKEQSSSSPLLTAHCSLGTSPPLLFAPIRGIRRKNLGELVLLSVLLPPPTRIAVSREPTDPVSQSIHETWRAFAAIHAPRIEFAVTDRIPPVPDAESSFHSWVHHCTHLVGTSIAEGFGLPFVEARAWNKPFLGRRLPHLRHLAPPDSCYDRLLIPKDWIAKVVLREQLETTLARDDRTRQSHPRLPYLDQILADLTKDDWLDFDNLPEPIQQSVIERCAAPYERTEIHLEIDGTIHPALPWLMARTSLPLPCSLLTDHSALLHRSPLTDHPAPLPRLFPRVSHLPAPSLSLFDLQPSTFRPSTLPLPPLTDHATLLPAYQSLLSTPESTTTTFLSQETILHTYHTPQSFHFLTAPPTPATSKHCLYQVVLFDIYGTLLHTSCGPVQPDPKADPILARLIRQLGFTPPDSPTTALHKAVLQYHASSSESFPEVDLRNLWRNILQPPPHTDLDRLLIATEDIRSPATPIPDAFAAVKHLSSLGVRLGLLSNAQSNALHSLDNIAILFDPDLIMLSYQLGVAKPSPHIFAEMASRLTARHILPEHVLYIGNSPDHDILPAQQEGWHTALYAHSPTTTDCHPTFLFSHYPTLLQKINSAP